MNLLPWLLDWPPKPAAVGVFLLLTAFGAGTLVAFGGVTDEISGGNVTVEATDLSVTLNDEVDFPDGENGTVRTCLRVGTPGDRITVRGRVTVDVPIDAEDRLDGDRTVLTVSLAHTRERTTTTIDRTGRVRTDVFWVLEDDETLSVGEHATVQVRVRTDGSTVAGTTRTVTVEEGSRTYEC